MQKVDTYTVDGKKKESASLPKEYDVVPKIKLLSQAIHVYEDRNHFGLAYAKTRSEVAISRKKIYKQKGTGGARHGAKSAPIFVGGGVAHGPKGIKRLLHLSNSQKAKALLYALNYKFADGKVAMVLGLDKINKTKIAAKLIASIAKDRDWKQDNILVAVSQKNKETVKFFRNISAVTVELFKNLNAYSVYKANAVIIDNEAVGEKGEAGKTLLRPSTSSGLRKGKAVSNKQKLGAKKVQKKEKSAAIKTVKKGRK